MHQAEPVGITKVSPKPTSYEGCTPRKTRGCLSALTGGKLRKPNLVPSRAYNTKPYSGFSRQGYVSTSSPSTLYSGFFTKAYIARLNENITRNSRHRKSRYKFCFLYLQGYNINVTKVVY